MKTKSKKKPTHQKVLMPPSSEQEESKPQSAKEGSLQAIALCHTLIADGAYPFNRRDQVKAALDYLEILHEQCKAMPEGPDPITPEVVSPPKETSLESVNAQA